MDPSSPLRPPEPAPAPQPVGDGAEPIDSDRLRAFVAVARTGGFSSAARRLGKTQPSVSQAVALLETELGAPLFLRQGRVTALSDAGRALLGHAEAMLARMAEARAEVLATQGLRAGQIVVGSSDTLATHLLPPVLGAFRARYPGVEIRLLNRPSPAVARAVAEGEAHVGVVSLPLPPAPAPRGPARTAAALSVEPLLTQRDVAIFPCGHPLAKRRSIDLGTLARYPLLLLDSTTASRAYLDASFAARGLTPRVAMDVTSVEVQKRLVELDFGLSMVPAWAVQRELSAGTLAAARIVGLSPPERAVGLVFPARTPAAPVTTAFVAIAREILRERPGRTRPGGG